MQPVRQVTKMLFLFSILLIWESKASAEEIFAVKAGTGTYILVIDDDGKITLSPLRIITPTDDPPTDDPSTDDPPSDFQKEVAALPTPDLPSERKGIAKIFESVADLNLTSPNQFTQSTNLLFNAAINESDDKDGWNDWKTALDSLIAAKDFTSVNDYNNAWTDIAEVLNK